MGWYCALCTDVPLCFSGFHNLEIKDRCYIQFLILGKIKQIKNQWLCGDFRENRSE